MTAITLNLLAEEQLAEQVNARDPLKTAVAICASVLTLVVMSGSLLYVIAGQKRIEVAMLRSRLDSLNASEEVTAAAGFRSVKSLADDLVAINHGRPLYADQLALIKDLVPDSIQLNRVAFTLSSEAHADGGSDAGDSASGETDKPRRTPVPRVSTRLNLQLGGSAMSNHPELEVDQFIQTLRGNAAFSKRVKQIQLRSIARSVPSNPGEVAAAVSAQFLIDCAYREVQ